MRATTIDDLDRVILEMINCDRAVIADIAVDQGENVYPMIPSGAAHNEMLLGPDKNRDNAEVTNAGMVLV
jgi:acetolactate synthase-1/2/3 large subunit